MNDMPSMTIARHTRSSRRGGPSARGAAALVVLASVLATVPPADANVCVRPPLRVRHLQGIAVVGREAAQRALPETSIRIESRDGKRAPIRLTTGADGRFSVDSLAPGKYDLVAESPPLDRIHVLLVVKRSWFWQGRDTRETVLRFGLDPDAPCGGSTVELRRHQKTAGERQ